MKINSSVGDKIAIPANCKATVKDNLIVIEEGAEGFKDGDILTAIDENISVIFRSYREDRPAFFESYYSSNWSGSNSKWYANSFIRATEEERRKLFEDLKSKGLRWNPETKELERIIGRAKTGRPYYFIEFSGKVVPAEEHESTLDGERWSAGNYYLPHEKKQAEEDAEAIRAILERRLKEFKN